MVAIVDSRVADHPWLDEVVSRLALDEARGEIVPAEDESGKEVYPNLIDPLQGMIDPFFGHGTFIAGLVRQNCPDADILSVKVMTPDGIVEEADLLTALDYLADRQLDAPGWASQIAPSTWSRCRWATTTRSLRTIAPTGRCRSGSTSCAASASLVVAAAGNDSTSRQFLPAAFTQYRNGVLQASCARADRRRLWLR